MNELLHTTTDAFYYGQSLSIFLSAASVRLDKISFRFTLVCWLCPITDKETFCQSFKNSIFIG